MMKVPAKHLLLVPRPDPEVVAMLTSGLTASIGLEKVKLLYVCFFTSCLVNKTMSTRMFVLHPDVNILLLFRQVK
jgi:hypothetical protein